METKPRAARAPALLFVFGASGTGKTTVVDRLARRNLPETICFHFDSRGVPDEDRMARRYGGPEEWQRAQTERWICDIAAEPQAVCVLEGQSRPSFVRPAIHKTAIACWRLVLLDCSSEVRAERLRRARGQPELATSRMDCWAAYLRGQADVLGLPIIDTGVASLSEVTDALEAIVAELRSEWATVPPLRGGGRAVE